MQPAEPDSKKKKTCFKKHDCTSVAVILSNWMGDKCTSLTATPLLFQEEKHLFLRHFHAASIFTLSVSLFDYLVFLCSQLQVYCNQAGPAFLCTPFLNPAEVLTACLLLRGYSIVPFTQSLLSSEIWDKVPQERKKLSGSSPHSLPHPLLRWSVLSSPVLLFCADRAQTLCSFPGKYFEHCLFSFLWISLLRMEDGADCWVIEQQIWLVWGFVHGRGLWCADERRVDGEAESRAGGSSVTCNQVSHLLTSHHSYGSECRQKQKMQN